MPDSIAKGLFKGLVGVENTSGLRNPIVKLLYLSMPVLLMTSQQIMRAARVPILTDFSLVVLLMFLYVGCILDFSPKGRPLFIRRSAFWLMFLFLLLIILSVHEGPIERVVVVFTEAYRFVPLLRDMPLTSWILILFIFVMFAALRNFTTRDAFWLGRKALWGRAFDVYASFVVTVATMSSALPLAIKTAWTISRDKTTLGKNVRLVRRPGLVARLVERFWLFVSIMLLNNSNMAIAIETLSYQRGLFKDSYRDGRLSAMSHEDVGAAILLLLVVCVMIAQVVTGAVH